jgi:hypothetical protein
MNINSIRLYREVTAVAALVALCLTLYGFTHDWPLSFGLAALSIVMFLLMTFFALFYRWQTEGRIFGEDDMLVKAWPGSRRFLIILVVSFCVSFFISEGRIGGGIVGGVFMCFFISIQYSFLMMIFSAVSEFARLDTSIKARVAMMFLLDVAVTAWIFVKLFTGIV